MAHQRTDFPKRDDEHFLAHTLVHREPDGTARIDHLPVTITRWPPGERVIWEVAMADRIVMEVSRYRPEIESEPFLKPTKFPSPANGRSWTV